MRLIQEYLDYKIKDIVHTELVLLLEKELGSLDQAVYLAIEQYFDVKVKTNEV